MTHHPLLAACAVVMGLSVFAACGSDDSGGGGATSSGGTDGGGTSSGDDGPATADGPATEEDAPSDAPTVPSVCISTKGLGANPPCVGTMRTLGDRPYCVNVPASAMGKRVPLVVLLHGYSASGQVQSSYFDMDAAAAKYGFILAKPDGKTNALGAKYWNASPACCAAPGDPTDDVAYVSSIVDDLSGAFMVDPKRVFAVGHSNGGFMAHRLACDRANVFAAVVSLAGMVDPDHCNPAGKISVLQVHGDADRTIAYGGGTAPGFSTAYPSVDTTLQTWATKNGCTGQRAPKGTYDLACNEGANKLPGEETSRESYEGCPAGIDVSLHRIKGGGHLPDFLTPAWSDAIMQFLSAHPKP